MTQDHLRPLLESPKDLHLLFTVCDLLAKGQIGEVVQAIKLADDSSPEGRRRRARHCGRRSHQKSHSQNNRPAIGQW